MAKHNRVYWPSWRYGPNVDPKTGEHEAAIFQAEKDVPKGWLDHPAKFTPKAKSEPEPVADGKHDVPPHVTRDQIKAQLDARGIVYTDNLSNKTLFNRLLDSFTDEEKKAALG